MEIKAIGLDLAKNVFQAFGVDGEDRPTLRRRLRRSQVMAFFATLPPCLIGMEACASAHDWARRLGELGHTVRLIAPHFVRPLVKGNKNDLRDAEAICEALLRPSTRFVAVKSIEQQAVLSLHRLRQGVIASRTALVNRLRGLMAEFGVVVPTGRQRLEQALPRLMPEAQLPVLLRDALEPMRSQLRAYDEQIAALESQLRSWHRTREDSQRLERIPGVGMLTATAAVATVGDAKAFSAGRQLAAWLGMTPGQHSSGDKTRLLGITKRGDSYLRQLLVHGARSVVRVHRPGKNEWLSAILQRRPRNVATVALAQKSARVIWALLANGTEYRQAAR